MKRASNISRALAALGAALLLARGSRGLPADRGPLALETPAGARVVPSGWVGDRIHANVDAWLLPAPAANPGMLGMFRVRDRNPEPSLVPWAGEFAGKYLISAVLALRTIDRPDLRDHVATFVRELVAAQAEDGYLGPFPKRDRLLGNWDLWGHYHVMEGLLLWHELSGDEAALAAALRAAELAAATYLDGARRPLDAGSPEMNLAISHVLGILHRKTGNERCLRLLRVIEDDWEKAGDYFRQGLAGVEFYRTPRPRWESLHDLQALVELWRITGDERYRVAFSSLWTSIRNRDRHNTGGFTTGEQAIGNPWTPGAIETCCTISWMAITADQLRLTGDSRAADELELSTFGGMLGAQHPSGRWWTYSTPMDGVREASAHSIVFQARAGTPELNCCSVNGPRGLGMLSEWAVLTDASGISLAWYGPMTASLRLPDGAPLAIETRTDYPAGDGTVDVLVSPARETDFTFRLRIPEWSRRTRVTLPGGAPAAATPGTWLPIRRTWRDGDRVRIVLDMRLRVLVGDRAQAGKVSLYRGPLLLAWDQVLSGVDADGIPKVDALALDGLEVPAAPPPAGASPRPFLVVEVPAAAGRTLRLADFASAGASGVPYRSWLAAERCPPPAVLLDSPRPRQKVPAGKVLLAWNGGRPSREIEASTVRLGASPDLGAGAVSVAAAGSRAVVDPEALELPPGREIFWRVDSRNAHGAASSETRSFTVDPSLPPAAAGPGALPPAPRPDGTIVAAPLRGEAAPSHGLLLDSRGLEAAAGPAGAAKGAVALDGVQGRIRYAVPWFPERTFTAAVRVRVDAFPEGRIGQVFSAWAGGMDDPLRITVDRGKLHARVEAGGSWSTDGVPIETGSWLHVAAVKSGSRLSIWIDGEERASAAVPEEVSSAAENIALGGNPNYAGNEHLRATFRDFVLCDRALGPEEIRALVRAP